MNDKQLETLISESLQNNETDLFPKVRKKHHFSSSFRHRMKHLFQDTEKTVFTSLRFWKWWFSLATMILSVTAFSLTAYGEKTNRVHFFADKFQEYQPLEQMSDDVPSTVKLAYDLDALTARYDRGVEILNGEQYTRFFHDPETNQFFEFSSYPKIYFRWHTDFQNMEHLTLDEKEITCFTDSRQIFYALWGADSTIFVVRSDMSREQVLENICTIKIYEVA